MKNLIALLATLAIVGPHALAAKTNYVSAANTFGLKNLQYVLEKNSNTNVVYSPISAHLALSMLLNGAAHKTADEIARTLNLAPNALTSTNAEVLKLMQDLNSRPAGELKLSLANGLWIKSGFDIRPAYQASMQKSFEAEVESLTSADQVNAWAAQKTNNLITHILDSIEGLEMILANATYFKADWTVPFDKARDGQFTALNEKTASNAQMMSEKTFTKYVKIANAEAVELPYGDKKLASMIVVLPSDAVDFVSFRRSVDAKFLADVVAQLDKADAQRISVTMPKVNATTGFEMNDSLADMGMPTVFTGAADLSLISETPLKVSKVKQDAVIKIDEKGTEAAAVTSVGFEATSIEIPTVSFVADRPFLYFIRDNKTGVILFAGQIVRP